MSGDVEYPPHLFPASPGKTSTLQVTRKLSRAGQEFDEDLLAEQEYYEVMERRGSSQSITRYSSCPHLAEKDVSSPKESYEVTVDDINTNPGASAKDYECVIVQSPSPILRRRLHLDSVQYSDTPTPPSTPKSRRSFMSSRDSILSSPEKPFAGPPGGTPRLLHRQQMAGSTLSRGSSVDSVDLPHAPHFKPVPLSVENVLKFQDETSAGEVSPCHRGPQSPKRPEVRISSQIPDTTIGHSHEVSDMVDKCESWLQTLQISQTDRIKSRSHIQLPPI